MSDQNISSSIPALNNLLNPLGLSSEIAEALGFDDINDAAANLFSTTLGDLLKAAIGSSPLVPDFLKDAATDAIDEAVQGSQQETTAEAESAVDENLAKVIENAVKEITDEAKEIADSSGKKGRNWLAILAQALGKVAGEHLANSVELADKIGSLGEGGGMSPADEAKEMAALQGEMQAETQMFKLIQEALTTIVKTVGEALSSTARKQ